MGREVPRLSLKGKGFQSTSVSLGSSTLHRKKQRSGNLSDLWTHIWVTQVRVGVGQLRYEMSLNSKIPPSLGCLISWKFVPGFTSGAQSLGVAEQAFGASPDCGTRGASFASPF